MKITDAHMHYSPQAGPELLAAFMDETGTDAAVIQAVAHSRCLSLVPGALVMKRKNPGRVFVFGSPDLSAYYLDGEKLGEVQAEYASLLLACGCDGIKLLEGKPQMRKAHPVPDFDSDCWEPFWAYAEREQVPILWHVNDPENFWSPDASAWLKKQGWWYDESFINNEEQYAQVLAVLERHSNLKIIFAHFFFMSAQLDRLDEILTRFPNIMVDLTPGIEMYENFSADPERTKEFFGKFGDRIVYGTDIGGRCVLTNEADPFCREENLRRPELVRTFLREQGELTVESDGWFLHDRAPFTMRCLGLPEDKLEKILSGNIERFCGRTPCAVDAEKVLELCAFLRERMIDLTETRADFCPDASELELAERYFSEVVYAEND